MSYTIDSVYKGTIRRDLLPASGHVNENGNLIISLVQIWYMFFGDTAY
jgi:hypothetical protein